MSTESDEKGEEKGEKMSVPRVRTPTLPLLPAESQSSYEKLMWQSCEVGIRSIRFKKIKINLSLTVSLI